MPENATNNLTEDFAAMEIAGELTTKALANAGGVSYSTARRWMDNGVSECDLVRRLVKRLPGRGRLAVARYVLGDPTFQFPERADGAGNVEPVTLSADGLTTWARMLKAFIAATKDKRIDERERAGLVEFLDDISDYVTDLRRAVSGAVRMKAG